jgi:undecaprenol kinase
MFIATVSVILGILFNITSVEWALLTITMGVLLSAEMVNTVVEEVTDHFVNEQSTTAKIVKDLGSGFVLVIAITTLIVLFLIFGKYLAPLIFQQY